MSSSNNHAMLIIIISRRDCDIMRTCFVVCASIPVRFLAVGPHPSAVRTRTNRARGRTARTSISAAGRIADHHHSDPKSPDRRPVGPNITHHPGSTNPRHKNRRQKHFRRRKRGCSTRRPASGCSSTENNGRDEPYQGKTAKGSLSAEAKATKIRGLLHPRSRRPAPTTAPHHCEPHSSSDTNSNVTCRTRCRADCSHPRSCGWYTSFCDEKLCCLLHHRRPAPTTVKHKYDRRSHSQDRGAASTCFTRCRVDCFEHDSDPR